MTSDVFKQEAYAQNTDQVFIILLTLDGDDLPEPINVCSDPYEELAGVDGNPWGCNSNGTNYIFLPFNITLPRDDNTGTVSAKITITNVDRRIVESARSVSSPLNVSIKAVLSGDVDFIEVQYDDFELTNVSYDSLVVEGNLTLDYWGLEPFPSARFTPSGFPGLF